MLRKVIERRRCSEALALLRLSAARLGGCGGRDRLSVGPAVAPRPLRVNRQSSWPPTAFNNQPDLVLGRSPRSADCDPSSICLSALVALGATQPLRSHRVQAGGSSWEGGVIASVVTEPDWSLAVCPAGSAAAPASAPQRSITTRCRSSCLLEDYFTAIGAPVSTQFTPNKPQYSPICRYLTIIDPKYTRNLTVACDLMGPSNSCL